MQTKPRSDAGAARALALLPDPALAGFARSFAYRATRERERGRASLAGWHAALRDTVDHELACRAGADAPTADPDGRLREAARLLTERDLALLILRAHAAASDFESHRGGPEMRFWTAVLAGLRIALRRTHASAIALDDAAAGTTPLPAWLVEEAW